MRIFIGIDLDSQVRSRIERFLQGARGFAPDARWARPESLHVTLKFIGEQPQERVEAISGNLREIKSDPIEIHFAGYGFFPTAKAARVFWIDAAAADLGIPREERVYSPHLTLARRGGGSGWPKRSKGDRPNTMFAALEDRLATMGQIDFGKMMARQFILFQSQLSPGGSKYTKLKSFQLNS
jgi:2'-5' RNA ligase